MNSMTKSSALVAIVDADHSHNKAMFQSCRTVLPIACVALHCVQKRKGDLERKHTG